VWESILLRNEKLWICVGLSVSGPGLGLSIVIDNRWSYFLLFFYQISIRVYFLTIDFQTYSGLPRSRYDIPFILPLGEPSRLDIQHIGKGVGRKFSRERQRKKTEN